MSAIRYDIYFIFKVFFEFFLFLVKVGCSVRILSHINSFIIERFKIVIDFLVYQYVEVRQCRLGFIIGICVAMVSLVIIKHQSDITQRVIITAIRRSACGQSYGHHQYQ